MLILPQTLALLRAFAPTGPVVLGIDETIERRRGEKIAAQGIDWDPVRSSHAHVVNARGWRGVSLRRLAPRPWTRRVWGVPCLTVLSPSERYDPHRRRAPRALLDRARQAVWLVRRWLPERELGVVGEHTDAALAWLDAVRHTVCRPHGHPYPSWGRRDPSGQDRSTNATASSNVVAMGFSLNPCVPACAACSASIRSGLIRAADSHQLGIGGGIDGRCDCMVDVSSSADDGPPQGHETPHTCAPALQSKNRPRH